MRLQEAPCIEEIAYFELSCDTWNAEVCPLNEVEAIAKQVDEFEALLQQHSALRHQTSQTRAEDVQRNNTLDELADNVLLSHETLTFALTEIEGEAPQMYPTEVIDSPQKDEPTDDSHKIEPDTVPTEGDDTEPTIYVPTPSVPTSVPHHPSIDHLSGAESVTVPEQTSAEISVEADDSPELDEDKTESPAGDKEEVAPQGDEIGETPQGVSPQQHEPSTESRPDGEAAGEPKETQEQAPAEAIDLPERDEQKGESHATEGEKTVSEVEGTDPIVDPPPPPDIVVEAPEAPAEPPSVAESESTKATVYPEVPKPDEALQPTPPAQDEAGITGGDRPEAASEPLPQTGATPVKPSGSTSPPPREKPKPKAKKGKGKAKAEPSAPTPSEPRPTYALTGPPHEVALAMTHQSTEENFDAFLYTLMDAGHLASAYWLVRSLNAGEGEASIPPWLLAAVQAARWLSPHAENFSSDLLDIVENHQPGSDEVQQLLGGAAALHSALIAPNSGTIAWLSGLNLSSPFTDFVAPILEFAQFGTALQPTDFMDAKGREELEASIEEAVTGATLWLERVPSSHPDLKRASNVLVYFGSPESIPYNLLHPVSTNQRAQVKEVRHQLSLLWSKNQIQKYIHEVDQQNFGYKYRRPIDGKYLRKIVRDVENAQRIAERWCNAVEREHEMQPEGNWLTERAEEMRLKVQNMQPDVEAALDELCPSEGELTATTAAVSCFRQTLAELRGTLSLTSEESDPLLNPADFLFADENDWVTDLTSALNLFLLWFPEISLDDDIQPLAEDLPKIAEALYSAYAEERTLPMAIESGLANQDYRFVEVLRRAVAEESERIELNDVIEEKRGDSRATLEKEVSKTMTAIEQAVVDGLLTEDERSGHSAIVEGITDDRGNIENFRPKFQELQAVQNQIATVRRERLDHLRDLWQQLQPQLAMTCPDPKQRERIIQMVEEAFESQDTIAAPPSDRTPSRASICSAVSEILTQVVVEYFEQISRSSSDGGEVQVDLSPADGGLDLLMTYRFSEWAAADEEVVAIRENLERFLNIYSTPPDLEINWTLGDGLYQIRLKVEESDLNPSLDKFNDFLQYVARTYTNFDSLHIDKDYWQRSHQLFPKSLSHFEEEVHRECLVHYTLRQLDTLFTLCKETVRLSLGAPLHALKNRLRELDRGGGSISERIDEIKEICNNVERYAVGFRFPKIDLFSLEEVLSEVCDRCNETYQSGQIGFRLGADIGKSSEVDGNPSQITECFLNLAKNAAEAIVEKREKLDTPIKDEEVCFNLIDAGEFYRILCQDTGIGATPEQLEQIFNVEKSDKPTGSGLGLKMVRRIIQTHAGSINATSRGIGHGICFEITLPKKQTS